MRRMKNVAAAVILVLIVVIVGQNTQEVETKLLFASISMPRALLLFITLVSGIVIGLLLGSRRSKAKTEAA